ncbi:MAG TPA: winged helix-turn-helix domain-containing protein [Actinophytocola sp.]|uniref:winged helix-turn-helix domain-containing protein n=1 Tax=Actinophytocola sp. TaxID=1872138 RepID=UPI002DBE3715|nr:winged helix-turn-helix domain-containing protein [Actinophytocola sp.]HEU5475658.1 winged helix-turn-helix domain-containing protein [Actinophytocola sp.]
MADTRALLIRLIRDYPGSTPADLAKAVDLPAATVRKTLSRMADKGQVRVAPGGAYYPPEPEAMTRGHAAPVTPVTQSLNPL